MHVDGQAYHSIEDADLRQQRQSPCTSANQGHYSKLPETATLSMPCAEVVRAQTLQITRHLVARSTHVSANTKLTARGTIGTSEYFKAAKSFPFLQDVRSACPSTKASK